MIVRAACLEDADGINDVYNPFILDSPATFETEPISKPSRRDWLKARSESERTPVFVAEIDGQVCAFANASPFDPRPGYATSVKTSVFVAPECVSRGVGRQVYAALFDTLKQTDIHRAYALIVAPNPASVALHRAFGFDHVSTLDEVGRKFGRYYSVMWFEKRFE
ncbi:MAG: N-acetyltransferase family protein [Pseudomonadota bacterium]